MFNVFLSFSFDAGNDKKSLAWKSRLAQLWLFYDYPAVFEFYNYIGEVH